MDTVCFKLFDQSPLAWGLVEPWAKMKGEFRKRGGFVLLACLAAHSDGIPDEQFRRYLPLLEWGATDERNFVKKGVSWALRRVGMRGPEVKQASLALAARLAASEHVGARWVGRDALRDLAKRR